MTKKALSKKYRGKLAFYTINGMTFPVRIEDAVHQYGIRFVIVPIGGSGRVTTKFANISFEPPAKRVRKVDATEQSEIVSQP